VYGQKATRVEDGISNRNSRSHWTGHKTIPRQKLASSIICALSLGAQQRGTHVSGSSNLNLWPYSLSRSSFLLSVCLRPALQFNIVSAHSRTVKNDRHSKGNAIATQRVTANTKLTNDVSVTCAK